MIETSRIFTNIENLDLVFVEEQIPLKDSNDLRFSRYKYSTSEYELNKSDANNIKLIKKNKTKTVEECALIEFQNENVQLNIEGYSRPSFKFAFGDLLKTMYFIVNEHGIKEINESELNNYESLKNIPSGNMNPSTIGRVILPYVYLDKYTITVSGYPWELHCNKNVKLKMTDENNFIYHHKDFQNYYYTDTFSYGMDPETYSVKSGHEYNFKYLRNDYILGETSEYLYYNDQKINITANQLGSFTGYIINKSLNRRVNHNFLLELYEENDEGNSGLINTQTKYYENNINKSLSGEFNLEGLLLNTRLKIDIFQKYGNNEIMYELNSEEFDPIIKLISGNINENIEIPYELYKLTIKYVNNKDESNLLTPIPLSAFSIDRIQNDGYDLIYNIGDGETVSSELFIRSGLYSNISFIDPINDVRYNYENFLMDKDLTFTFRHHCDTCRIYIQLNDRRSTLNIYDEEGNLYVTKQIEDPIENPDGLIGPLVLKNIVYSFEEILPNGINVVTLRRKINEDYETIDLR